MRIYLASRWRNRVVLHLMRERLQELGHTITSRWLDEAHDLPAVSAAYQDLTDIDTSDAIVLWPDLTPPMSKYGGLFVEFGYALAANKQIYHIDDGSSPCVFLQLPQVITLKSWDELYQQLTPVISVLP